MTKVTSTFILICVFSLSMAQPNLDHEIRQIQLDNFYSEGCFDFIRPSDLPALKEVAISQIIIIRHGEPAMDKKGWKTREEAIRYTEMYDSVGVYDFDKKPICLRVHDVDTVFTSKLPRAIDTAEKTFADEIELQQMALFNEFERKIIKFPDIYLPRSFWSGTSRLLWTVGFNDKGIESFKEAKDRSKAAAHFLNNYATVHGKSVLFAHGFLNRYIKKYLKQEGYKVIDMDGDKYLGAYYFYKTN